MLSLSPGLTSIQGSTSLFRYTVPDWAATLSTTQPANGLAPEVATSGPGANGPASAGSTPTASAAATKSEMKRSLKRTPPFPVKVPIAAEIFIDGTEDQIRMPG